MTDYESKLDAIIKEASVNSNGIIEIYGFFYIDTNTGLCMTKNCQVEYEHWRSQIIAHLRQDEAERIHRDGQRAKWQKLRE